MRISRENKARTFSQNCSGDPIFGIEAEGLVFVQSLITGMIVYDAYVCIRKFRRIISHNLFAIAVEDVLFWLGMSLFLTVQMYYASDGSIRWYFVMGVLMGCGLCAMVERRFKKTK